MTNQDYPEHPDDCVVSRIIGADCECPLECDQLSDTDLFRNQASQMTPEMSWQVNDFLILLYRGSSSPLRWHGGILHCQIDDLNVDMDSRIEKQKTEPTAEERQLCAAWDALSLPQRSQVVLRWRNEDPDEKDDLYQLCTGRYAQTVGTT